MTGEVEAAVEAQVRNRPPQFVDPSLILKVRMEGTLLEDDWKAIGLTLLASDEDKNIVLFSSAGDLNALIQRLDAFDGPIPEGQRGCRYEGFVSRIELVSPVAPRDRLGVRMREEGFAHVRSITNAFEPSPFTRKGPGAGGIQKPDFVDIGGTLVFDAPSARLQGAPMFPEAGLITLNHELLRQLVTSGNGTSYAAPMLANKAAYLLWRFPWATSNLILALLAGAAAIPAPSANALRGFDEIAKARITGNGLVDTLRAAYSDDHRVVLFAQYRLGINEFAVYRAPIPAEFQTNGRRTIRVALDFDRPVRRTSAEYIGTKMNFRLLQGCELDDVFEHFRARNEEEGDPPNKPSQFKCGLEPGPNSRDRNTLQTAAKTFTRETTAYGGEYFLVVRCIGGWAEEQKASQNFAVTVELEH